MTILYTASFYQPQNWQGSLFRVSRYHPRGRKSQWHTLSDFYPPVELLKAYRNGDMDFDNFALQYINGLQNSLNHDPVMTRWINTLPELADLTLLCFEREGQPCHRHVLARWLKEVQPALQLASPLR